MRPFWDKYFEYLGKHRIGCSPIGGTWLYGYTTNFPTEGFKIHISLEEDLLESDQVFEVMCYLLHHQVNFKLIRYDRRHVLSDLQAGKQLVLYPFLDEIDRLIASLFLHFPFLSDTPQVFVPHDAHVKGRVFTRYAGYQNDYILNPNSNEYIYWDRYAATYKPDWIEVPGFMSKTS